MLKLKTILLPVILTGLLGCNQTADAEPSDSGRSVKYALDNVVTSWASKTAIPSVVVRIHNQNEQIYAGAAGEYSFSDTQPATADSYFRSASVGKLFTAATVLKLAEQNKLNLDDPIGHYLSQELLNSLYGSYGASVTIAQLLSHTSGLANIDNDPAKNTWMAEQPTAPKSPYKLLEFAAALGLQYIPGNDQLYTSAGYILLGLIIEQVTQQPYHLVVRQQVLVPLGLKDTFEETHERPSGIKLLHSYAGAYNMNQLHPSMEFADGGFVTTTADLNRFGLALARGELFNQPKTLEKMLTPLGKKDIGLGPFISSNSDGETDFYHPGHWGVLLYVVPSKQLAISFTVNQAEANYTELLEQLLSIVND